MATVGDGEGIESVRGTRRVAFYTTRRGIYLFKTRFIVISYVSFNYT